MTYAYTANSGASTVSKIDLSTFLTVGSALGVGSGPYGIAIDPTNTYAYVWNDTDFSVSKVDLSTLLWVANIVVGTRPHSIAIAVGLNPMRIIGIV